MSRYQSLAPQGHIAARCGGCKAATCHWLTAKYLESLSAEESRELVERLAAAS
jgi:hypothetical protein